MKDGKIDQYDIPEMVFIITDLINNTPSITLTAENLSDLVKKLFEFIVKEYKLTPDETQMSNFSRLIESSIKLVMLQPKIKDAVNIILTQSQNVLYKYVEDFKSEFTQQCKYERFKLESHDAKCTHRSKPYHD